MESTTSEPDKRLICSQVESDGTIKYLVFNVSELSLEKLSYNEALESVMTRHITNAKLENTVIKSVDSVCSQSQLRCSFDSSSNMLYIFDRYESKNGSNIISMISNTGEIFELSENLAAKYIKSNNLQLINATITRSGNLKISKIKGFTSPLSRSYEGAHNVHR
jgi:hypothetical protein